MTGSAMRRWTMLWIGLRRMKAPDLENALLDRVTNHGDEFAHQAVGHLPGHRQLALALEFDDRGLGVGTGGAGRFQLAVAIFGERALHRRHAARARQLRVRHSPD